MPIQALVRVTLTPTNSCALRRLRNVQIPRPKQANAANQILDQLIRSCLLSEGVSSIDPTLQMSETASSARLQREMTALTTTPDFRTNPELLQAYATLSRKRRNLQLEGRRAALNTQWETLLNC